MLTQLRIQNLILIESLNIHFEEGFHVITGETGSGKSAMIAALAFICGEKADVAMIRQSADRAVVEASFDLANLPGCCSMLEEAGIAHLAGEELLIQRELLRSGRSRAFINNQLASLQLLKQLSAQLIEIVGQHANQLLLSKAAHLEILDLFADAVPLKTAFKDAYEKECRLRKQLEDHYLSAAARLRESEALQHEVEELEQAAIVENEDEELFAEYTRLSKFEEIATFAHHIAALLTEDSQAVIPSLHGVKSSFQKLVAYDPSLASSLQLFQTAVIELEEVAHVMASTAACSEYNPLRIEEINARLALLNKLKKKYGPTLEEARERLPLAKAKLGALKNSEEAIDELQIEITNAHTATNQAASALSQKRKRASLAFEKSMNEALAKLNMSRACFFVILKEEERSLRGDESAEFFLTPNVGEKSIAIKDFASGGELSRLVLAIQTLMAGKTSIPTIIFDEVDSNIGGETAAVVGDMLKRLGNTRQVLGITHFPQVAKRACHHIHIYKEEIAGRTHSQVAFLEEAGRLKELDRMSGNGSLTCGLGAQSGI